MEVKEIEKIIYDVLQETGILIDRSEEDIDLRDFFQDSVQYISFVVNLEQRLGIEIPDDMLLLDSMASFHNFCTRVCSLVNDSIIA